MPDQGFPTGEAPTTQGVGSPTPNTVALWKIYVSKRKNQDPCGWGGGLGRDGPPIDPPVDLEDSMLNDVVVIVNCTSNAQDQHVAYCIGRCFLKKGQHVPVCMCV